MLDENMSIVDMAAINDVSTSIVKKKKKKITLNSVKRRKFPFIETNISSKNEDGKSLYENIYRAR